MTLWQDERPMTRREARDSEREASLTRERNFGSRRSPVAETTAVIDDRTVVDPSPLAEVRTFDQTLTRRELRAMLTARDGSQQAGVAAAETPSPVPMSISPTASLAPSALSPVTPVFIEPGVPASDVAKVDSSAPTSTDSISPPFRREAESSAVFESAVLPNESGSAPPAAFGGRVIEGAPVTTAFVAPLGPPSTASELQEPFDQVVSRSIANTGAVTTTNALILPSMPQSSSMRSGSVQETGEVLLTGSIDLPQSLSTTGAHPNRFDTADIDRLFDQNDALVDTGDVLPIKASCAVSTHTSSQGVLSPPKWGSNRLPMILAITAATMALGVVVLFVGAYVLRIF